MNNLSITNSNTMQCSTFYVTTIYDNFTNDNKITIYSGIYVIGSTSGNITICSRRLYCGYSNSGWVL